MSDQFLNSLKYIKTEPVPESVWPSIQQAIARKRLQVVPMWMRVAAALVVLTLIGEILLSFKTSPHSYQAGEYTAVFNQNNQWYHD